MGDFYQELNTGADAIKETLYSEEIKFRETLSKGLEILGQELPKIKNNKLDGKIAFKLYDTFGFPLDFVRFRKGFLLISRESPLISDGFLLNFL